MDDANYRKEGRKEGKVLLGVGMERKREGMNEKEEQKEKGHWAKGGLCAR